MKQLMAALCGVWLVVTCSVQGQVAPATAPVMYHGVFHELRLSAIEPQGWLKQWLINQQQGQTGDMQPGGHPFDVKVWAENHPKNCNVGPKGVWACHEQTGYWIDGQMRCGHLLRDEDLIAKARTQTEGAIKIAHTDGFIGPLADDGSQFFYIQWPHVTFFRAFMADYSATGNAAILNALKAHYDREIKHGDINPRTNRHICNIEQLCWLYEQTGEKRYLDEARRIMDHSKQIPLYSRPDYTAYNAHGVTFMEKAKTPVIMYLYTGDETYLKAGLNAVGLLHRYHMLPDGVPSSCAGLFEDKPDLSHETCGISDYTWAAGYALLATGDAAWADRIERAVFNAGPGAVTKDFKAHQYYSAPNQAIATHNNYNALASYGPVHGPECCSGNIHRFMPNYIARMWMSDNGRGLAAVMYGPSTVTATIDGQKVTIEEKTSYPFGDEVEFVVKSDKPVMFPLYLRIPEWCEAPKLLINRQPADVPLKSGSFAKIDRLFADGDRVALSIPATPKARRWRGNGIIVERGSMLFALDIPTTVTIDRKDKHGKDPRFPSYNMEPAKGASWRYALDLDTLRGADERIVLKRGQMSDQPFRIGADVLWLEAPARRIPDEQWALKTEVGKDRTSVMTPWPEKWTPGAAETIKLVPYGATCLRIAIFPDASKTGAER